MTRALARLAPVLWTEHGVLPERGLRSGILGPYRSAARHARAIVCVSTGVRDQLDRLLSASRPPLVAIPNGIDIDRFSPPSADERAAARSHYGIPEGAVVVGSVGRLHANKQIDLAVMAVAQIPNAVLVIAGSGPDESRLRRLAKGGNVRFLGHVDDVAPVYRALDTLVFTSLGEGFGLVVAEAASVGVPTVAVEGSRAEELATRLGGTVVPRDPDAIARAIAVMRGRKARRDLVEARYASKVWLDAHADLMSEVAPVTHLRRPIRAPAGRL